MQCSNQLKQMGLAAMNYESTFQAMPPRRNLNAGSRRGWGPSILPYIEQTALQGEYRFDRDFYAPENEKNISIALPLFLCPSGTGARIVTVIENGVTSEGKAGDYFGPNSFRSNLYGTATLSGNNKITAMDDLPRFRRLADITDGLSNTMLITEQAGRADFYIAGACNQQLGLSQQRVGVRGPRTKFFNYKLQVLMVSPETDMADHAPSIATTVKESTAFIPAALYAVFVDGSVHLLNESLDAEVLISLITINGHEVISQEF